MPPRLGILLAITFWGVSFVATKAAVREISPWALIFARALLGTLLLTGILASKRGPVLPPRDAWRPLAVMGLVGVAFHQCLQAIALTMTTATNTGWLIGLTPIWAAILAAVTLGENLGPLKVAGLVTGFAGAVVVMTRGHLDPRLLKLPSTHGDLLILASTINWAIYSVLGRKTIRRLGPTRATAGAMLCGLLALLPVLLITSAWRDFTHLSVSGWGAVLFLGIACSGLGYLFYYNALEKMETSRVAAFFYLEPLVTLGAAAVLLGERVGVATIAGGLLLLGGVVLVQRAPERVRTVAVEGATRGGSGE